VEPYQQFLQQKATHWSFVVVTLDHATGFFAGSLYSILAFFELG
jgi:hypothetical protein